MGIPMVKRNYQSEMDEYISTLTHKPTILLHSCCAPCSSYVLTCLLEYFDITVFFYNPNITNEEEYNKRLDEQKRLIDLINSEYNSNVKLLYNDYDNSVFLDFAKDMEDYPEGGKRCEKCFALRMNETALICAKNGFDLFATTLTLSPHKNADLVNMAGERASQKFDCKYLASDFKKKNGYKISIELSKKYNLYRQNYCGCIYSQRNNEK